MDAEKIGALIRDRRTEKGMTQKELAAQLNVTDKAVSKWERGLCFPDICIVEKLGNTLDISMEEFFTDWEKKKENNSIEQYIKNALKYAEQTEKEKKIRHRWKIVALCIILSPVAAFLISIIAYSMMIPIFEASADPDAGLGMGLMIILLLLYLRQLLPPALSGYVLLCWYTSGFMNQGQRRRVKQWVSLIGGILILAWFVWSLKIRTWPF